ncbi:AAA family ATPase [Nitrospira sp. BLG_2]|uniref:AAA family ATPase n=1 Tax=Nitrospira sp. BLG_2 TaxID=3397507 RepID=UPI003B9BE8CD
MLADQLAAAYANGVNGQPQSMSTSPSPIADLVYETCSDRAFDSLILPGTVAKECRALIEEHRRTDLLRSFGISPRHRVLLVGPPGNGKTSLAESLANELMVPMLSIRYEGIIGSYLGETATRLRKVFDYARQRACLLFFDEFETLGKERGDEHETGEIKRVVSALLLQIDSLPPHVVVVTATNHRELLDRAVWRRFQLRLELPRPTQQQATEFLDRLFAQLEFARGLQASIFAKSFRGASYSDIEDFVRDLARRYVLAIPNGDVQKIARDRLAAWKSRACSESR